MINIAFTKDQQAAYRAQRIAMGYCSSCRRNESKDGFKTCQPCLDAASSRRVKK